MCSSMQDVNISQLALVSFERVNSYCGSSSNSGGAVAAHQAKTDSIQYRSTLAVPVERWFLLLARISTMLRGGLAASQQPAVVAFLPEHVCFLFKTNLKIQQ